MKVILNDDGFMIRYPIGPDAEERERQELNEEIDELKELHQKVLSIYHGKDSRINLSEKEIQRLLVVLVELITVRVDERDLILEREAEWIPASKPPKQDGEYLVTRRSFNRDKIEILSYANNLQYIDDYYFRNIERAGWYDYDSEYGYFECGGVTAWCKLPKPYKESEG